MGYIGRKMASEKGIRYIKKLKKLEKIREQIQQKVNVKQGDSRDKVQSAYEFFKNFSLNSKDLYPSQKKKQSEVAADNILKAVQTPQEEKY